MSLDRSIHQVYRKVLDRIDSVKYGPQKAKGPWRMREAAEEVRVPVILIMILNILCYSSLISMLRL